MHILKPAFVLSAFVTALATFASVGAQVPTSQPPGSGATVTPVASATSTESPGPQASPSPEPSPQASPTACTSTCGLELQPPIPLPIVAVATLRGTLKVDTDGDGLPSAGDTPAETLVELRSPERQVQFSVFTSPTDGSFEFADVPNGDYELSIWWGPGFINALPVATNPSLVIAAVTVGTDGSIRAPALDLLGKPNTKGTVPFPVRSGGDGQPASGSVNVRASYQAQFTTLPSSGLANGADAVSSIVAFGVAASLLGLCLGAAGISLRRRREA